MWLILEGVDGAGKSTFAMTLRSMLPESLLFHLGPPESADTALSECIDEAFGMYDPNRHTYISDRHHWGCPVYGPIYRPDKNYDGYGDMGAAGWRYVEMLCASRGALTVLVDEDTETILGRIDERGDDYVDPNDIAAIRSRYHTLRAESITNHGFTIVPSDMSDSAPQDVIDYARQLGDAARPIVANWPSYVGPMKPELLVVCPPFRLARLEIVEMLGENYGRAGIMSSSVSPAIIQNLANHLDVKDVVTVGDVNPALLYDNVALTDVANFGRLADHT